MTCDDLQSYLTFKEHYLTSWACSAPLPPLHSAPRTPLMPRAWEVRRIGDGAGSFSAWIPLCSGGTSGSIAQPRKAVMEGWTWNAGTVYLVWKMFSSWSVVDVWWLIWKLRMRWGQWCFQTDVGVDSFGRRADCCSKSERREYHVFKLFHGEVKLVLPYAW